MGAGDHPGPPVRACISSFLALGTLQRGPGRLPSSGSPAACRTEQPGRLAAHSVPFPAALSPAFTGGRIAFPPAAVWGRWGGAVELGLEKEVAVPIDEALPSSGLFRPPSRLLSVHSPLPLLCPHLFQTQAWLGHSCQGPRVPFGSIQFLQNDSDTRVRALLPQTPWHNRRSRVCEGGGFYLVALSLFQGSENHQQKGEDKEWGREPASSSATARPPKAPEP